MNERPIIRTSIYLAAIAVLLIPLAMLSQPPAAATGGRIEGASAGGQLAQLRSKYELNQANLGEIDPTSETMRLATFGMRGVATIMLWQRAVEYQKTENWSALEATLDQITKLQPNFITVWRYQAWNQSYNVSVEFDDYRDRYAWVMKGLNFLKEGISYNEREPRLQWDMGWITSHKIGTADEKKEFRKLFAQDSDFNGPLNIPKSQWDNWLVGRLFFLEGEDLILNKGVILKGIAEMNYFSNAPLTLMRYAENLEIDGIFGEKAQIAWRNAARAWDEYGNRDLPTFDGDIVRLNDMEDYLSRADALEKDFNERLAPGLKDRLTQAKIDALTEEQRAAWLKPMEERTYDEHRLATSLIPIVHVPSSELIEAVDEDIREETRKIWTEIDKLRLRAENVKSFRRVMNFDHWKSRGKLSQRTDVINANRLLYEARTAFEDTGELTEPRRKFEEAFATWASLMEDEEFKEVVMQSDISDTLRDYIQSYSRLLQQQAEPFPEDFALKELMEDDRD